MDAMETDTTAAVNDSDTTSQSPKQVEESETPAVAIPPVNVPSEAPVDPADVKEPDTAPTEEVVSTTDTGNPVIIIPGLDEKPISVHEFAHFIPDVDREYNLKEVYEIWGLEERDVKKTCKPRVFRNPGKPYPDYFYKGVELLEAAKERYGDEDSFIQELRSQAKCFVADPLKSPPIRYVVLCPTEDELYRARQVEGTFDAGKSAAKLMALFQEAEIVCLLIAHSRGFRTWGVMETMPTPMFTAALNETTMLPFREIPRLYDDQLDCFTVNGQELPTDLGLAVTVALGGTVFDDVLEEKRRADRRDREKNRDSDRRSSKRRKSRSPSRSRSRERRKRTKSPQTPELKLNPTSLNLMNVPAGMSRSEVQKVEAARVIEKRKRQGFYI
eukprot:m.115562 g.115562  ORF g.115562 m.115562 type:complete len:386 (-) comp28435_c0_seq1:127-1284(-)